MKKRQIANLCAWFLGTILFSNPMAYAQRPSLTRQVPVYNVQTVLQQLTGANVVYLGETHDNPEDHLVQLQIIEELHRRNPNIAIAMEMFQRPFQFYLDRYLANDINELQLRDRTQFKQRWGYPWEYYAPILRFAKDNRLPVLALNTPTEVTRKVARSGLESLSRSEQRYIPPFSEIRTDNGAYRLMMLQIYEQMHAGRGRSDGFERFFQAQVVWDETMADVIAQFLRTNPDFQVVAIVGQGHIIYGHGIPSRVARRLGSPNLVQRSVLLNPPASVDGTDKSIADFIWRSIARD